MIPNSALNKQNGSLLILATVRTQIIGTLGKDGYMNLSMSSKATFKNFGKMEKPVLTFPNLAIINTI